MFLNIYIEHYKKIWNSIYTIKERKDYFKTLLEEKTGNKIKNNIKKLELIKQLAEYDYNIYNKKYEQFHPSVLIQRDLPIYDKQQIGVTWIKHHEPEIIAPLWVKVTDNCQCPDYVDNVLCKYNNNNNNRELYVNLHELYKGKDIAWNTNQFKHLLRHIKRQIYIEKEYTHNNLNFLSLMPHLLSNYHGKNKQIIKKSKYLIRSKGNMYDFQRKTVDWMRNIEQKVDKRKYIEYETDLDYIYQWKDTNIYYNTRTDMVNIGYSKLQAFMAFKGGILATEDGLGKTKICGNLIIENPKKYKDMYGTMIICQEHLINHWKNELSLISDPIFKIITIKNNSDLKKNKKNLEDAEVVIVSTAMASKLSSNIWFRIIFDDPIYIHNINLPQSVYRWVLFDITKYELVWDHIHFLKHLFSLLNIETQNPRRNSNNDSLLLRKVCSINNNVKNTLDMNILNTFFDNLYYRDIKDNYKNILPKINNYDIKVTWTSDEQQYYAHLLEECNRNNKIINKELLSCYITLYNKSQTRMIKELKLCTDQNIDQVIKTHNNHILNVLTSDLFTINEQILQLRPEDDIYHYNYLKIQKDKLNNELNNFENLQEFRNNELINIKTNFNNKSQICDVCWDNCDEPVILLRCMHYYCKKCIHRLNSMVCHQCPKCKTTFNDFNKVLYKSQRVLTQKIESSKYGSKINTLIQYIKENGTSIIYTSNYEIKEYIDTIFKENNIKGNIIITSIHNIFGKKYIDVANIIIFDEIQSVNSKKIYKTLLDIIYHLGRKSDINFVKLIDSINF